jgi:hypothetical protein
MSKENQSRRQQRRGLLPTAELWTLAEATVLTSGRLDPPAGNLLDESTETRQRRK